MNELNKKQVELIGVLVDQASNLQLALGKTLRHGLDSSNPESDHPDFNIKNAELICRGLGDVVASIDIITKNELSKDITKEKIQDYRDRKKIKIKSWVHNIEV